MDKIEAIGAAIHQAELARRRRVFEHDARIAEARAILDEGLRCGIPGNLRAFIEARIAQHEKGKT